jgi:hypothetical protein
MIQARAQLDDFRAKIDMEVAKLAASYRSEFALAEAREAALAKLVVATKNEMAKANASEVDVRMLEREVDINRTLMKQLADRLNDTRADIDRKGPEARVISSAVVPHLPTFPPKLAITVIAFLFCVTGGTILAVVLERWDASIRSTAQLRQITAARVFGMLPAVRRAGRMRQSPPVRVIADRRSMFVEALRAIWFHIEFVRQGDAKTLSSLRQCRGRARAAPPLRSHVCWRSPGVKWRSSTVTCVIPACTTHSASAPFLGWRNTSRQGLVSITSFRRTGNRGPVSWRQAPP